MRLGTGWSPGGKLYTGGLFALAQHINYFGYTLWRAGVALLTGSPIFGGLVALFFASDFVRRGIPVLQHYLLEYAPAVSFGRIAACDAADARRFRSAQAIRRAAAPV